MPVVEAGYVNLYARDITERRQAENALRASEQKYRNLVETSLHMIFILDPNGNFLFTNSAWNRHIGYAEDEERPNGFELIHPEDLELIKKKFVEVLEGKIVESLELRSKTNYGSYIHVLINASPIFDSRKNVVSILGVAVDITDKKQSEEKLRESEEKYRLLFESETDAIMVFDGESRKFKRPNLAASNLYGYSREEFLKMRLQDISAEQEESEMTFRKTLAGQLPKVPLRYHRKKDGTVFPVEISSGMFTLKEKQIVIGAVRDITERKKMEVALQRKHDMLARTEHVAHIGSWEWEVATDTVIWSEELFRIFQLTPADRAPSYAEHPKLYHPEDMQSLNKAVDASLSDGTPYEIEMRAIRKDGTTRYCQARGYPARDSGRQGYAPVWIITGHHRAQAGRKGCSG